MSKKPPKNIIRWAMQRPANLLMNMIALAAVIVCIATTFAIGYYKGDRDRQQMDINASYAMDVCRDKPDFIKCIDFFSQAVNKPFNKTE